MNRLKPYPTYKDADVSWLGEVPEHWELPRLGTLLRERGEENDTGLVTNVLSVLRDRGVIPYAEKGNIGNKKSDDITRYKIVRPDDIVVNSMNVIIGSVGLSRYTGCLSQVYYVLTRRSEIDDPRYLDAYFQTKPFQQSLVRIGNGILAHRMRIPMGLLKCEPFPRPPSSEQTAIVKYLDYMNRRIRRYINTKKKLIALLNEQKQAIIHQAVTRGLDPDVRLKPSGLEWLGDIPEHWEVRRLKYVCRFEYGDSLPDNMRVRGDIAVYGSNGKIGTHDRGNTSAPCIVIGRKGSFGKVTFSSDSVFAIDTTFFIDERYTSANLRWLYYILTWTKLDSVSKDSAVPGLDRGEAYTQQITYCPRDEQVKIAGWLDQQLASVDRAILKINKEIDLLREYRTRLIADMVTGKLDVREAAASLPDETEGKLSTFEEVESLIDNGAAVDDDEEALTEVTDDD